MLGLIVIMTFTTVMMFCCPLLKYVTVNRKYIFRIKRYISVEDTGEESRSKARGDLRAGLNILSKGIAGFKLLDGFKKSTRQELGKAHVMLKAEEFITLRLILLVGASAFICLITRSAPQAVLAGIAGWLAPRFCVRSRMRKRIKTLNEQLGDAIVLISNSLKAGYSFFQAADIVSKEMTGPISEEFYILQKEINLGLTTEAALENLAERVLSDDLELMVTAVLIQRQAGGNLAEILDNISSTIRDRVKIKGEVRIVTAQGRISGLIISVLPLALGVLIYLINPEYMGILFKTPAGIAILAYSAFMELIGVFLINKIVKIEV